MLAMNIWASIIKMSRDLISEIETDQIATPTLIDWETHAELHELPNTDVLGPSTLAVEEISPQMIQVNFSIAVSSYDDPNLFRHREMMARVFERLRPEMQVSLYDAQNSQYLGWMTIVDGTLLAPMSRAQARPFQFVQAAALILPTAT